MIGDEDIIRVRKSVEKRKRYPESRLRMSKKNNAKENLFLDKYPPNHYGHLRLELIACLGVEKGEEIYELFGRWGARLPYIAFSAKGVMMSHSIGLPSEVMSGISIEKDDNN